MNSGENEKKDWVGIVTSVVVTTALVIAIAVAIVTLVVALSIFRDSQKEWSNSFTSIASSFNTSPSTPLPTFLPRSFVNSQTTATSTSTPDIKTLVEYLERINSIQKASSTTDLLVFLYGFMCSILIGVGAYFVNNSKRNAESTSKTVKKTLRKVNKYSADVKALENIVKEYESNVSSLKVTQDEITNKLVSHDILSLSILSCNLIMTCETLLFTESNSEDEVVKRKELISRVLPRFNENVLRINELTQILSTPEIRHEDKNAIISIWGQIQQCLKQCQIKGWVFSDNYINDQLETIMTCTQILENVTSSNVVP